MDFFSNQILLPLGGIFIAIFVGWVMKRENVLEELEINEGWVLKAWYFLLKFLSAYPQKIGATTCGKVVSCWQLVVSTDVEDRIEKVVVNLRFHKI